MGYIALPSILNAIIGTTSYYCVILKIVALHDGIKTIQNWVFLFSLKKRTESCFFLKNLFFSKKQKKTGGLFFFEKKNRFFSTLLHVATNFEICNYMYFIELICTQVQTKFPRLAPNFKNLGTCNSI